MFVLVWFVHWLCLVVFLYSTWVKSYSICLLHLISLSIIPSRSIHVVTNGKISLFILLSSILLCVCVCMCVYTYTSHLLYPFMHWWALRLFLYLGYRKSCCDDLSKPMVCKIPRVNSNILNYGLWVIMMCRCRLMDCSKCTTLVRDVGNGGGWAHMGKWESLHFLLNFAVNIKLP